MPRDHSRFRGWGGAIAAVMMPGLTLAAEVGHTVTVSADWSTYQGSPPGWWVVQNPWGAGQLKNGRDYTQTVSVETSSFPSRTVVGWNWPGYPNPTNVWGYPELVYGSQAGTWQSPDGKGPRPIRIRDLTALTGAYDVSIAGETDQFDVLWETHLTSAPNSGSSVEFAILLHSPPYVTSWFARLPDKHHYHSEKLTATIAVTDNGNEPYILVAPDQGDMLSGSLDIKALLDFLISAGILAGGEYINGLEMGAEPRQGHGKLIINSIAYNWNGMSEPSGRQQPPASHRAANSK